MKITKTPALLLAYVLAALSLSACKSSAPSAAADERAGRKSHVHADGSVHYH